jgi:tetratricopeptide (TPR) repeat protein
VETYNDRNDIAHFLKKLNDIHLATNGGQKRAQSVNIPPHLFEELNHLISTHFQGAVTPSEQLTAPIDVLKQIHWLFDQLILAIESEDKRLEYYNELAEILTVYNDWEGAEKVLTSARELAQQLKQPFREAQSVEGIARVKSHQSRWSEAMTMFDEAVGIYKELKDNSGQGRCLKWQGTVAGQKGDLELAEDNFNRALELAEDADDRLTLADLNNNLGILSTIRGDPDKAIVYYQDCLPYYQSIGDNLRLAQTYHNLGMASADKGDLGRAGEYYEKSIAKSRQVGNSDLVAKTYLNRAELSISIAEIELAGAYCREAMKTFMKIGNRQGVAESLKILGVAEGRRGDWERSEGYFKKSLELFREIQDRLNQAETFCEWGRMCLKKSDLAKAREYLNKSLEIFKKLNATNNIREVNDLLVELGSNSGKNNKS